MSRVEFPRGKTPHRARTFQEDGANGSAPGCFTAGSVHSNAAGSPPNFCRSVEYAGRSRALPALCRSLCTGNVVSMLRATSSSSITGPTGINFQWRSPPSTGSPANGPAPDELIRRQSERGFLVAARLSTSVSRIGKVPMVNLFSKQLLAAPSGILAIVIKPRGLILFLPRVWDAVPAKNKSRIPQAFALLPG